MTTASYASAIAQLAQEVQDLDERRTRVGAALDTLRALDGGAVVSAPATSAAPRAKRPGAAKTAGKRSKKAAAAAESTRGRISAEQLAELKRCFTRGDNVEELAEAMGVSGAAIYYHAKKGQWARAGATVSSRAKPAPGAKAITPTQTATRTCDSCYQRTRQDPCEHCDAVWKR